MPIQIEMIIEHRVVLQTFSEPLDSAQLNELRNNMERVILPAAMQKVHIIVDARKLKHVPKTILGTGTGMLRAPHPNTGMIVCISTNSFISAMARSFGKLLPLHSFAIVSSLEAALEIIRPILQRTD
jgi:hypothetical protein